MRINSLLSVGVITAMFLCLAGCQTTPSPSRCMAKAKPIVIAHRGASGYRPEHTLAAYQLAMEQGADFVEPDLVLTKDGHLIARHENELSDTTNVAEHIEFNSRKTIKNIDGLTTAGWFSEDFTLAEIKTLRARERIPAIRPANNSFNNQFEIPTLAEIIALINNYEKTTGRKVGLYPETKHPTYFQYEGRYLDGKTINQSISKNLVIILRQEKFTDPQRVFIQSFEVENLIELQNELMPSVAIDLPLIQLYGDLMDSSDSFGIPHDIRFHRESGDDMSAIYGALVENISATEIFGYADLSSKDALQKIKTLYADGIGPWKSSIYLTVDLDPENPRSTKQQTGKIHPLVSNAKNAGLLVHPYTFRFETVYLPLAADGSKLTVENEIRQYLELGINGFFIDQPDIGKKVIDDLCQ
jgi:glycerophosphoryl diester phosphodiesterase